jgi:Tol biopolymer transport system component
VNETTALRLTTGPDSHPAWSPDGTRIAYAREGSAGGIYSVSPLGGPERKISGLSTNAQLSWSPDGKWLALARRVARSRGLLLLPADEGEPRQLTDPEFPYFEQGPAFSPDGGQLAYAGCSSDFGCDVYVQQFGRDDLLHGSPRRVTHQQVEIFGIAWSRDGRTLIYSAAHTISTPYLWRVASDGKSEPQRLEIAGVRASSPAISALGNRLAFETGLENPDIFRYSVGGSIEPFITSSLTDESPQYSPDGTRIVFCSDRAGRGYELWLAQADGSNQVQLTHGPGRNQGSPSWSPDSRWIVFDSEGQDGIFRIYAIEASGGPPRQISGASPRLGPWDQGSKYMPFFGPDGKWVYFKVNQARVGHIWRMPFEGGHEEQVAMNVAQFGFPSADGTRLIYAKHADRPGGPLFSMPIDGGEERQILPWIDWRSFAVNANGVYYIGRETAEGEHPIEFYRFSTQSSRVLTKFKGRVLKGMSVSPDGQEILFVSSVTSGSDLMMIENFR